MGIQIELTRNHNVPVTNAETSLFGGNSGIERAITTRPVEFAIGGEVESGGTRASSTEAALRNLRRVVNGLGRGENIGPTTMQLARPEGLLTLVRDNLPESANLLITLVGNGDDTISDPASILLANVWDSLTREQIEAYFKTAMTVEVKHKKRYVSGSGDQITSLTQFRPGYSGLPDDRKTKVELTVSHLLDGQPHGKPQTFGDRSPATIVFIRDIPLGKHRLKTVARFRFTRDGQSYEGTAESTEAEFEVAATN